MWLTSSSIGRKFIMALTGAFLILFVTFHVLMNGVAIFWPAAYNVVCEFLGANWYALVGTLILAGGFLLHILYALWLTWQNRRARGADRYAVTSRPKQVEWSSKNMLVLGIVVICFLILHMWQFWAKMQLVEILHLPSDCPPAAGTLFLQQTFSQPWVVIVYLIGFGALYLHMTHGFWSMFHSCGWDNGIWINRLKAISTVWAIVVCGLFAIEAVVFTVNAKQCNYLKCPELQEQYIEMMENSDEVYPMTIFDSCEGCCADSCCADCCGEACDKACDKACGDCEGCCGDCEGCCGEACDKACGDCCQAEATEAGYVEVDVQEFTNN